MLFSCCKYLFYLKHSAIVIVTLLIGSAISTTAQQIHLNNDSTKFNLNPLLRFNDKRSLHQYQQLFEYIKPSKHELMYWPNFPLDATQIEARDREWKRRNSKTFGGQIISDITKDIIKDQINTLIYGKKMPVAVAPKF